MKRLKYTGLILATLLLVGSISVSALILFPNHLAKAQSSQQSYDVSWYTIDGGGHTWSSGGTYSLGGTIGQPDAGDLAGGNYTLGGGFWEGEAGECAQVDLISVTMAM